MVEYELQDGVAVLTINRPEARNAVNGDVARAMEAAIDRLEAEDGVWIGIIAGAGTVFCAGADLKEVSSGNGASISTKRGGFGGIARRDRAKPLIAAVDGAALAGGTEIALSCDLIVASTRASFGIPEVKRSLIAGAGGLFRLPRALPRNIALELALTGDPITAERAHHFGLVNEICAPGQAVAAALVLAKRITANAPLAVQASRRVVLAGAQASDEDAWSLTASEFATVIGTEDYREGPLAFIEKRPPVWKGR